MPTDFDYSKLGPVDLTGSFNSLSQAQTYAAEAKGGMLRALNDVLGKQIDRKFQSEEAQKQRNFQGDQNRQDRLEAQLALGRKMDASKRELYIQGENQMRVEGMRQKNDMDIARVKAAEETRKKQVENFSKAIGTEQGLRVKFNKKDEAGIWSAHEVSLMDVDPTLKGLDEHQLYARGVAARGEKGAAEFVKMARTPQTLWTVDYTKVGSMARSLMEHYGPEAGPQVASAFMDQFKDEPGKLDEAIKSTFKDFNTSLDRDVPGRSEQVQGTPADFGDTGRPVLPKQTHSTDLEQRASSAPFRPVYEVNSQLLKNAGVTAAQLLGGNALNQSYYNEVIGKSGIEVRPILEDSGVPDGKIVGWKVQAPPTTDAALIQKVQAWADSDLGFRALTSSVLGGGVLNPDQVEHRMLFSADATSKRGGIPNQSKPLLREAIQQPQGTPAPRSVPRDNNDVRTFLDTWRD